MRMEIEIGACVGIRKALGNPQSKQKRLGSRASSGGKMEQRDDQQTIRRKQDDKRWKC